MVDLLPRLPLARSQSDWQPISGGSTHDRLADELLRGSSPGEPGVGLIEGDCLSVMQGMATGSVGQIVTSPPYNLRNSTGGGLKNNSGGNWSNARLANGYGICTDDVPRPQYVNWLRKCLEEMMRLIPDDGAVFYNSKERVQGGLRETPEEIVSDFPVRQTIIWKRPGSGNHNEGYFNPNHEIIYLIAKPKFKMSKEIRAHGAVWEFRPARGNPHPAPFPLELAQRCVQASSARIVLDPFNGSGTTGIAAVLEGRDYLGIELEPEFIRQTFHRFGTEGSRADWGLRIARHKSAGRAPSYPYLPHVRPQSLALIKSSDPDWPKLMKEETAARYLSIGVRTLRSLGLERSKHGRLTVYNRRTLDCWADSLLPSSSLTEGLGQTQKVEQDFLARRSRRSE